MAEVMNRKPRICQGTLKAIDAMQVKFRHKRKYLETQPENLFIVLMST